MGHVLPEIIARVDQVCVCWLLPDCANGNGVQCRVCLVSCMVMLGSPEESSTSNLGVKSMIWSMVVIA